MSIFDLNITHFFDKYDLQNNLLKLEKLFGNEFIIKYNLNNKIIKFTVNLQKKLLPNNTQFYRLIYKSKNITTKLNPLMIDFIDIITNKLNNNSYINDIQKVNNISGSELLLIALRICEILGVKKINLIDTTSIYINDIPCSLSFVKLLESEKTFYMKFGFDFEISNTQLPFIRYENLNLLQLQISKLINSIRKIKIKDIIEEYDLTLKIIGKDDKSKIKIMIDNGSIPTENIEIFVKNPIEHIDSIIIESYSMINLLNNYPDITYLYELFIKLFKSSSDDYLILHKYVIDNKRTKIILDKEIITRNYIYDINILLTLQNSYYYSYEFY